MLLVHTFDPQWKVPVTLCDPIADFEFYNLIDLVSFPLDYRLAHIMAGIGEQTAFISHHCVGISMTS